MKKGSLLFIVLLSALSIDNGCLSAEECQTAEDYFRQGVYLKSRGSIEASRKSLQRAITLDKNGPIGKSAAIYLRARLTKYPVTEAMEKENAHAYNLMTAGDIVTAISEMTTMTRKYPNFEWPFGNLGYIYIKQRRYEDGVKVLTKAVTINPNYANAWSNLAECYRRLGNSASAAECRRRAEVALPKDFDNLHP